MKKKKHLGFSMFEAIQQLKIYIALVAGVNKKAHKKNLAPIHILKE